MILVSALVTNLNQDNRQDRWPSKLSLESNYYQAFVKWFGQLKVL